jgi:Flp pilus assembly protein TadD
MAEQIFLQHSKILSSFFYTEDWMSTLFQWTSDSKMTSITRAHFDARHGRVRLALQRLEDLSWIFPEDPDVAQAEAFVRMDHIGQGEHARKLFKKAFRWGQNNPAAAKNVTLLARSAEEFRELAEIALPLNPKDRNFQKQVEVINQSLSEGMKFWYTLGLRVASSEQQKDYGPAAGLAELSLSYAKEMGGEIELQSRKTRAKCLRELDKIAANRRQAMLEPVSPEERLALQEAVKELDEILRLDEYDPEMWNFKSAWCSLLHRFDEADACADRAISLRPHGYPKPWTNKGDVRLKQKTYAEALAMARKALEVAQGTNYKSDIALAEGIIKRATHPPQPLTADDLPSYTFVFLSKADTVSDEEIGGYGPVDKLVNGLLLRLMDLKMPQGARAVIAELTSDFTPETVGRILAGMRSRNHGLFEVALIGMLYVIVNAQGAFKRDAVRLLILTMLRSGNKTPIRNWYRRLVLIPSQADPALLSLAEIVEKELGYINAELPKIIAQQPQPSAAEKQQFCNPTKKFGDLPEFLYISSPSRFFIKLLGTLFLGIIIIIWLLYYFFK